MAPQRIQRKRTRGFKLPPNTVVITRPGPFGNPYKVGAQYKTPFDGETFTVTLENCLELCRLWAEAMAYADPHWLDPIRSAEFIACFCKVDAPCHGDILLDLIKTIPAPQTDLMPRISSEDIVVIRPDQLVWLTDEQVRSMRAIEAIKRMETK